MLKGQGRDEKSEARSLTGAETQKSGLLGTTGVILDG